MFSNSPPNYRTKNIKYLTPWKINKIEPPHKSQSTCLKTDTCKEIYLTTLRNNKK